MRSVNLLSQQHNTKEQKQSYKRTKIVLQNLCNHSIFTQSCIFLIISLWMNTVWIRNHESLAIFLRFFNPLRVGSKVSLDKRSEKGNFLNFQKNILLALRADLKSNRREAFKNFTKQDRVALSYEYLQINASYLCCRLRSYV